MSTLDPAVRSHIDASERALRANDRETALRHAREAMRFAPQQVDALRQFAAALSAFGPSAEAIDAIERAVAQRPDDVALLTLRAIVLEANGRPRDALAAFRRADEIAQHSTSSLYNLGRALSKYAAPEESLRVLDQVLQRDQRHRGARATRAELLRQLGRTGDAVADYRRLLALDANDVKVWSALAALSTQFDDAELAQLEHLERDAQAPEAKARLAFSLGRVYEYRGRYADAFAAFTRANAVVRSVSPWNAMAFSAQVDAIRAAFDKPSQTTGELGKGILFIVSLPRSGSTLTEQMLAAHPDVDAGDERSDLFDVIAAEGARRRLSLARWAPQATSEDWARLGQAYLDRTAQWRTGKPFATDKMPTNWLWLGAAFAMLPGSRVIECRRDRLETAWSCYAHVFAAGAQEFSYDIDSIAAYARDYDRTMATWKSLYPARIRTQDYESLVADTEPQLRELLAFCGLEFDPACLRFHETQRTVRTASAAQVREPLRKDTARADKYGALLDPLRAALGLPRRPPSDDEMTTTPHPALEPQRRDAKAQAALAETLRKQGRFAEAAAEFRGILAADARSGSAWWNLAQLKPMPLTATDVATMRDVLRRSDVARNDRIAMHFALAIAQEQGNDFPAAFAELQAGHALAAQAEPYDAAEFSGQLVEILQAFSPAPARAEPAQGDEIIFIASLPRSGSTLTEQILASHSQVEGGSELHDLGEVLMAECARLRRPFTDWARTHSPQQWHALGEAYLARTQRWRTRRPRMTDKMPANWMYVGAILAMLPQARVLICRRDPLETCLACYRYIFAKHPYTHDFASLAAHWRDFDRAARQWQQLHADRVRVQVYEELVADQETQIRELLAFCGLPFEEGCLNFHETAREVNTPSAAQVREPLSKDTARSGKYGALLDPLRHALGLPPFVG